ncbi:P27 family phage terminase small subunit [Hutsoniella sourekii]|uniref:P27 family phage terminase small subunit n=1 Tax=Hutsoniella sourekii TaxID=87650 RepID=UPI0004ACBBBB|nr:P27 family phage terminase small subunit [Hutsoniella sourekii]
MAKQIALSRVKKELMSKIDETDAIEVEKVERYISLIELMRSLQKKIDEEGATVVTKNASQEFTKSHPALNEIGKLNSQLINLERSFNYKEPEVQEESPVKKVSLV